MSKQISLSVLFSLVFLAFTATTQSQSVKGTDYYFPNIDIAGLDQAAIPQTCFWKAWYAGNYFAYSKTVPIGSGNNPDTWVAYSPAKFKLPVGSTLVLKGKYSHSRYQSIDTYYGPYPTDSTSGNKIEADQGSINTFRLGSDRHSKSRDWTIYLVDQVKPAEPEPNTLYLKPATIGSAAHLPSELRYRVYLPDRGRDILGGVGYPTPERLELADGSVIEGEDNICRVINVNTSLGDLTESAIPTAIWKALIDGSSNPERAPAQEVPKWERFFTFPYYLGRFLLPEGAEQRSKIKVPVPKGGGGGQMAGTTANGYVGANLSHETKDRVIAVTRVKLPHTPITFDNPKTLAATGDLQAQYWSICTNIDPAGNGLNAEGYPTGVRQGMCHNDETVVLNDERFTRIVHSQPQHRPKNATNECGWSWLNSGPGDYWGRPVTQLLVRPGLAGEPSYTNNSVNVLYPGTEAEVMGDYLPVTEYMSLEEFEALGCDSNGYLQSRPDLPAPVWGTEQAIKPAYKAVKEPEGEVPTKFFEVLKLLKSLSPTKP